MKWFALSIIPIASGLTTLAMGINLATLSLLCLIAQFHLLGFLMYWYRRQRRAALDMDRVLHNLQS